MKPKFKVGDRVRIARNNNPILKRFIDEVDTVKEIIPKDDDEFAYVTERHEKFLNVPIHWHETHLDLVVDDGRQVVAWDDCAWKPEGMGESRE